MEFCPEYNSMMLPGKIKCHIYGLDVNNITNKPLLEILNGISDGNHNLKVFDGDLFSDLSRELYLATFRLNLLKRMEILGLLLLI